MRPVTTGRSATMASRASEPSEEDWTDSIAVEGAIATMVASGRFSLAHASPVVPAWAPTRVSGVLKSSEEVAVVSALVTKPMLAM